MHNFINSKDLTPQLGIVCTSAIAQQPPPTIRISLTTTSRKLKIPLTTNIEQYENTTQQPTAPDQYETITHINPKLPEPQTPAQQQMTPQLPPTPTIDSSSTNSSSAWPTTQSINRSQDVKEKYTNYALRPILHL